MICEICGEDSAEFICIDCNRKVCEKCAVFCEMQKKGFCVETLGKIEIYRCDGIFCKKCADFSLVHKCYKCNITFCNAILDEKIYECPKCLNKLCPDCKKTHKLTCNDIFNREDALKDLFEQITNKKA